MAKVAKAKTPRVPKEPKVVLPKVEEKPIEKEVEKPIEPPPLPKILFNPAIPIPASVKMEGVTLKEKIVNVLTENFALINEPLRTEFKDELKLQNVNKRIRFILMQLVAEGKIEVENQAHTKLGQHYYKEGTNVTQYYTAVNTRLNCKLK